LKKNLDDYIDYVQVYKELIDTVFEMYPYFEAVEQTVRQILPTAEKALNPVQYEQVKKYADERIKNEKED
jgi:hypothetical protein